MLRLELGSSFFPFPCLQTVLEHLTWTQIEKCQRPYRVSWA